MKFPGDKMDKTAAKEQFKVPKELLDYVDTLLGKKDHATGYKRDGKLTPKGQALAHLVFNLGKVESNADLRDALTEALGNKAISGQDFAVMINCLRG